jgi:hypothetical protein
MIKEKITLPDGRYLIYYRFEDEKPPEADEQPPEREPGTGAER